MRALAGLGVGALLLGTASLAAGIVAGGRLGALSAAPVTAAAPAGSGPAATPVPGTPPREAPTSAPSPPARSFATLQAEVDSLLTAAGASGGVSLIELAGADPQPWSDNGDQRFVAASTYKLPLLMEDAQDVATGRASPSDQLCYDADDWEDGYFSDYEPGDCFSRATLDQRAGTYSDNTAARILVRYDGGTDALNAYARAHGATESAFYDPNVSTSSDLARLWVDEAEGRAGGARAQAYLYPLLTDTAYEEGIPAGTPAGTTVVHKIGILDAEVNDAALIESGPRGPYVLTVCTEAGGWPLVASIARAAAQFEAS